MNAKRRLSKSISLIIVTAILLGLVLSSASAQEPVPVLAISGGDDQSAAIGTAYAVPLQVTVTSNGAPVAGVMVQFTAPSSGASIAPDIFTATTDASGVASATAAANWYAGAFEVLASYGGQTAVFHLTNAGTLAISGGSAQSAVMGTVYALPLQVTVTDAAGRVAGAMVEFIAPSSGASLNPDHFYATTDTNGVASATVTANGYTGHVEVLAKYGGQTAIFDLTNTPTLRVTISGGDDQSAVMGTVYALPLQVTVTDAGAPVAGGLVEFVAPSEPGFASLNPATFTATTDASGVANAAVAANEYAGVFEVLASYGGETAIFYLSNTDTPTLGGVYDLGDGPLYVESHCEFNDGIAAGDPSANGNAHVCAGQANKEDCERYKYCWWWDTTNHNALSEHTLDQFTGTVVIPWQEGDKLVAVYSSMNGGNIATVVDGNDYLVVGCGGAQPTAQAAKSAFNAAIPGFNRKILKAVVVPSSGEEFYRWCSYWTKFQPIPVYVNQSWESVQVYQNQVATQRWARLAKTYGMNLAPGPEGSIGAGSMFRYVPGSSGVSVPLTDVAADTTITLGTTPITVMLVHGEDAGLLTYLPDQDTVIVANLGQYLPDAGSIVRRNQPVGETIATLNKILMLTPEVLVSLNGQPIINTVEEPLKVSAAVTAQRDALWSILGQTRSGINSRLALDDIVNQVELPAALQGPYTEQFAGTVPFVVRQVYQDHLGWFDDDVTHLESLPSLEKATRLIEFGGGENAVLSYVKKCLTEHTRQGVIEALEKLSALRKVYPSPTADAYYKQALKMLAYTTPSAYIRNYYLEEALGVTDAW